MLKQAWKYIKDLYRINGFSFIYAVVAISAIIGFVPQLPQVVVYGITIAFAFYCLAKPHTTTTLIVILLAYIPVELLLAQPDPVFKSWFRYALFGLVLTCVSPLVQSKKHRAMRNQMLTIVLWACTFLGVGSFFARFLGINFMTETREALYNVGYFGGLTVHSILLGLVSGVGAVFMAYKAYTKRKNYYWFFMALCLFSILFSASRIALASCIAGVVVMLYKQSGSSGRLMKIAVITLVLGASTFPLWDSALDGIVKKNEGSTSAISINSRESKWTARIDEFISSPLWGIGFVSIDADLSDDEFSSKGVIEPGTSWLSILSMLGLIGAILVIPLFIKSFLTVWSNPKGLNPLKVGLLTLMYVDMIAEGYIFSGGAYECFMLWLFVGVAYDSKF